jgi:hypothetical protein
MKPDSSPMLTRAEAAAWCRVSVAAFDAHVRPHLAMRRVGRRTEPISKLGRALRQKRSQRPRLCARRFPRTGIRRFCSSCWLILALARYARS